MPYTISRKEALERIRSVLGEQECIACYVPEASTHVLHKGRYTTVLLSAFPRTWGQTMVVLNAHKTNISELSAEEWQELSENSRIAAVTLEEQLKPLRCYVSSLGATSNLPNSCPHIHFNVLPVYEHSDKPSEIFSWKDGVLAADEEEWTALYARMKKGWGSPCSEEI